jgi:GNAT superfamily N-acetyltransferase
MSNPEVTVGKSKNIPTQPPQGKEPQVAIRTYSQPVDQKFVQYAFYSTYLNLVPEGIYARLKSPPIIIFWLMVSTFAYIEIPKALLHLELSGKFMLGIKIFLVIASIAIGLVAIIWYVDKMVISARIEHGLVNDMGDIQQFYLGFDTEQTMDGDKKITKIKPVEGEKNDSHFWVLTVDDNVIGCIGLNHSQVDKMDKYYTEPIKAAAKTPEPVEPAVDQNSWLVKGFNAVAKVDDLISSCVVSGHNAAVSVYRKVVPTPDNVVLFKAHKRNEASLQRLAVKTEYQSHGLASVLIKRAILWAHQHKIEYLFATTDELQKQMASILSTKYGFQKVEEKKTGYYGRETLWRLDVNEWIEKSLKEKEQEAQQNVGEKSQKATSPAKK